MSTTPDYSQRYTSSPSSASSSFTDMLMNKWSRYLPLNDVKEFVSNQPAFNANDFSMGMRTAFTGFSHAWNNPKIKDTYWGLIRTVGASMVLLYSVAFVAMLFLLPILVFFPGKCSYNYYSASFSF